METLQAVVWLLAGIAAVVVLFQILRTAMEAENFLRGLRERLLPILEDHRVTSANVREILERSRETVEVYQKGVLKPALWAASAFAAARGVAERLTRRGKGDEHGAA